MLIRLNGRMQARGIPEYWMLKELESLLTYANPKYLELRKLGKWTGKTPRRICYVQSSPFATEYGYSASMPRGAYHRRGKVIELLKAFNEHNGSAESIWMEDAREEGEQISATLRATLRPWQQRCVEATRLEEQGLIVAPTGSGKTVIGLAIVAEHRRKTLIVTHTRELLYQWCDAITKFLPDCTVGHIGGGTKERDGDVIVATVQTLKNRDAMPNIGVLIVDECHHTPASTWGDVVDRIPARRRYGMTATPQRRDGAHHLLSLYIGDVLETVPRGEVEDWGGIVPFDVRFVINESITSELIGATEWMEIKQALAADGARNELIASVAADDNKPTLILTDYIAHAGTLACMTGGVLLHGQLNKRQREEAFTKAKSGASVTVATTGLLGEGVDASAWSRLILALPFTSRGSRLNQAIGRVVRPAPGKERAEVIDISDPHESCWSAESGRRRFYERLGAEVVG